MRSDNDWAHYWKHNGLCMGTIFMLYTFMKPNEQISHARNEHHPARSMVLPATPDGRNTKFAVHYETLVRHAYEADGITRPADPPLQPPPFVSPSVIRPMLTAWWPRSGKRSIGWRRP